MREPRDVSTRLNPSRPPPPTLAFLESQLRRFKHFLLGGVKGKQPQERKEHLSRNLNQLHQRPCWRLADSASVGVVGGPRPMGTCWRGRHPGQGWGRWCGRRATVTLASGCSAGLLGLREAPRGPGSSLRCCGLGSGRAGPGSPPRQLPCTARKRVTALRSEFSSCVTPRHARVPVLLSRCWLLQCSCRGLGAVSSRTSWLWRICLS